MSFETLLQILNGDFYVPRKALFSDEREFGFIPLKNRFALRPICDDSELANRALEECKKSIDDYKERMNKSRFLLTSCWTLNCMENYLMWKAYAPQIGVCVRTTIGKLRDAIKFDETDYITICSPMEYKGGETFSDFLASLFKKDLYYESEQEIRFYFVHKDCLPHKSTDDNDKVEKTLMKAIEFEQKEFKGKSSNYKMHEMFSIDPESLIDSISISPFLKQETFYYLLQSLEQRYPHIYCPNGKKNLLGIGPKIYKSNIIYR